MVASNIDGFKQFFHAMLENGVAFDPSAYEACLMSAAHIPIMMDETIAVIQKAFTTMAK